MLRQGSAVVWRSTSEATGLATVDLPSGLPPGLYRLEAVTGQDSRAIDVTLGKPQRENSIPVISFNANLAASERLRFVGHQWLLRGNLPEARRSLEASIREAPTVEAQIDLARADALGGGLDAARDRVQRVLSASPENFEALSVYAGIEAQLQDYPVAAELYRRALAIQDSPDLRAALAQLPVR